MKTILLLSFIVPVIGSPQLAARGDSLVNPDWGSIFGGVASFLGGLGTAAQNLFLNPDDSSSSTDEKLLSPADSATPTVGSTPTAAGTPLPLANSKCDPNELAANSQNCDVPVDRLVFSSSCVHIDTKKTPSDADIAQNKIITEKVTAIAGSEVRISRTAFCDVYMWIVPLTEEERADLLDNTPGIDAIERNIPVKFPHPLKNADQNQQDPVARPVGGKKRLIKRDEILYDSNAWEDLRSISTPNNHELSSRYSYRAEGGDGMIVILVDSGVNILHDEFNTRPRPIIEDYIYGTDTSGLPTDTTGFGTCRATKAVGPRYGVAKNADLLIAKVTEHIGSVIDALLKIIDRLDVKDNLGFNVRGYYVLTMPMEWEDPEPDTAERFKDLIDWLITVFEVVVVVPTGNDPTGQNSFIHTWPAILSLEMPLLAIGAVHADTGRIYPWSNRGDEYAVYAPGKVRCALNQAGDGFTDDYWGTDMAAAQVAGLVAYFLSLHDEGPSLRADELGVPHAVRELFRHRASYVRSSGSGATDRIVWNLLGP